MQNGYVERFNKTFREDALDAIIFENLNQMRGCIEDWTDGYNNEHPHSSVGDHSPIEFRKRKIA